MKKQLYPKTNVVVVKTPSGKRVSHLQYVEEEEQGSSQQGLDLTLSLVEIDLDKWTTTKAFKDIFWRILPYKGGSAMPVGEISSGTERTFHFAPGVYWVFPTKGNRVHLGDPIIFGVR